MIEILNSLFKLIDCINFIDKGKECFRYIKNIEKKFSTEEMKKKNFKSHKLQRTKALNLYSTKTFESQFNHTSDLENQKTIFSKKIKFVLKNFICVQKKKVINNVFSNLFKINLLTCKLKEISGFLMYTNSLRYSKFIISGNALFTQAIDQTISNIIKYFTFFQIH